MTALPKRPKLSRKAGAVVLTAALAAGGVAVIAPPASATVTTLCTGYAGCTKAGMSNAGYVTAGKSMYWRMYSGHNCTNYAAYRMVKAGMPNTRPWTGSGNATNWGTAMSRLTSQVPRVGSVAWWKAGVSPAGSAGHVAYVERVVSSTEIIVSMDSWHGDFSWARVTKATKGWPSGFVHFKDVQIANTAVPKISGTAKVGNTLSTTTGSWSVAGAAYAYQWMANGAAISGATASTLPLTNALTGKTITVRVIASKLGYPNTLAMSTATGAVQPGVIDNTAAPTISGEPRVDSTLSATPGSWSPTPSSLSYRWLADGAYVDGATSSTLALGPGMVGKSIKVEVTATKPGYPAKKALSVATGPVAPGQMRSAAAPEVKGQATPGTTLRLGAISADPAASRKIRWSRGYSLIPGATGASYRLTAADLGHRVRAVVYLERRGYRQQVVPSSWTSLVRATPVLGVTTTPGHRRLAFRATVRSAYVPNLDGVLQLRSAGKVLRQVAVHDGTAAATVTGLPVGTRTYRFRLVSTSKYAGDVVVRRLAIRQ